MRNPEFTVVTVHALDNPIQGGHPDDEGAATGKRQCDVNPIQFPPLSPKGPATGKRRMEEADRHGKEQRSFADAQPERRLCTLKGESHLESAYHQEEHADKAGKKLKYRSCLRLRFPGFRTHT